jgi:hypothetical protein
MSYARALSVLGALAVAALLPGSALAQGRGPPRPDPGGQVPPGSYQQTCRGISLDGNILRAQCRGPTGAPIFSSLDINGCRGRDIQNDAGYLRCNVIGGPQPPRPPGPFPPGTPGPPSHRVQAIAYTLPNYRGRELPISGPIQNLANHRGFNDQIRSIRIMRGRIEVCTDSRYRGRCTTIRQSYRDLQAIGMSNAISSIR